MTKMRRKISKVIIQVGKAMAKVSTNTACPWINYQPKEPKAVTTMRKSKAGGKR